MISRRIRICLFFFTCLLVVGVVPIYGTDPAAELPFDVDALSAVLMDAETGEILYAKNPDEALPPASVTNLMTLLLVMEAIDSGQILMSDMVSVSENAASMGGSQVYLEPGEVMSVEDLIKCVVIASANDAACALAEYVAGSEAAFVEMMNVRAAELGMENAHFENTNGLDDTVKNHVMSARDIAIMSRALLSHEKIMEYTTIWQDTIRGGAFTLTNTNRLVRFYPGATGLKTGSTSKALFCISASAKRNGMHLIAVVMGSPTRDIRNAEAKKLLDLGFASYASYKTDGEELPRMSVQGGKSDDVGLRIAPISLLLEKGKEKRVEVKISLPDTLCAPILTDKPIGYAEYSVDGVVVGKADILATEEVQKISYRDLLYRLFCKTIGAFPSITD